MIPLPLHILLWCFLCSFQSSLLVSQLEGILFLCIWPHLILYLKFLNTNVEDWDLKWVGAGSRRGGGMGWCQGRSFVGAGGRSCWAGGPRGRHSPPAEGVSVNERPASKRVWAESAGHRARRDPLSTAQPGGGPGASTRRGR